MAEETLNLSDPYHNISKAMLEKLELMTFSTLIIIKPPAVSRNLVNPIMEEFTRRGYKVLWSIMCTPTKEMAEEHYKEHKGKPFFPKITAQLSSGPVYVCVIGNGESNCLKSVRKFVGATDPKSAEASTIRARYGSSLDDNVIHASDSEASARRETALWVTNNF